MDTVFDIMLLAIEALLPKRHRWIVLYLALLGVVGYTIFYFYKTWEAVVELAQRLKHKIQRLDPLMPNIDIRFPCSFYKGTSRLGAGDPALHCIKASLPCRRQHRTTLDWPVHRQVFGSLLHRRNVARLADLVCHDCNVWERQFAHIQKRSLKETVPGYFCLICSICSKRFSNSSNRTSLATDL
jgi:hypothetical protein